MFKTPILLLVFNRPDTTKKVLESIRQVQPKYLFIAADGPREGRASDVEKCAATRQLVLNSIDWDCEVKTLFRDRNLGCGHNPASAITWFFDSVEEGIILEDDCVPTPFFFTYSETLLQRYRSDDRVMHISGHNPIAPYPSQNPLLLSKYSFIWGWATWRRAWKNYDYQMQSWAEPNSKQTVKDACLNGKEWKYWKQAFDRYSSGDNKSVWDYQWQFALFINKGLSIVPSHSLIENIGIGHPDATHTTGEVGEKQLVSMGFDLASDKSVVREDYDFDAAVFNKVFIHWLPKFNLKIFLYENGYKYLPKPVQKFVSAVIK